MNLDTFQKEVLGFEAENDIFDFEVDENQTITYLTSQGELIQENVDNNTSIPRTCARLSGINTPDTTPILACAGGFILTVADDLDGTGEIIYYLVSVNPGEEEANIVTQMPLYHSHPESQHAHNPVSKLHAIHKATGSTTTSFIIGVLESYFIDVLAVNSEIRKFIECGQVRVHLKPDPQLKYSALLDSSVIVSNGDQVFQMRIDFAKF